MRALLLLLVATSSATAQPAPQPAPTVPPYEPPQPAQPPPGGPAPYQPAQPAQPPPGPPPPPTVMDKRWAVGVFFGPESFSTDQGTKPKVQFGFAEIALRYRCYRFLEIGLALHGGGTKYMDVELGDGGLFLDARYRFLAERPANVYVGLGLGAISVADKDATDTENRGRGAVRLFVGGEYRWSWFALAAELRFFGVGENPDVPLDMPPTVGNELARYGLSGGSLGLGANAYW